MVLPLVGTESLFATSGSATQSPIPHEVPPPQRKGAPPAGHLSQYATGLYDSTAIQGILRKTTENYGFILLPFLPGYEINLQQVFVNVPSSELHAMSGPRQLIPILLLFCFAGMRGEAQSTGGGAVLTGVVTDPTGARVPRASVQVHCGDSERDLRAQDNGSFALPVVPGICSVAAEAAGFVRGERTNITVRAGQRTEIDLHLGLPVLLEQLTVASGESLSAEENKGAMVFEGESLAELSDDERTMQRQLLALAGGDEQHLPEIFVDGFSSGRIPPKNSITRVRINANPYSSQYDHFGLGQLEVFTKPGTQQLHGSFEALGSDSPWNSNDPYTGVEPPYYALQLSGTVSGSLGKKTALFGSGLNFNERNQAVVNAVMPGGALSESVPDPQVTNTYSLRVDRQVTAGDTLTGRYQFNQIALTNGGVGLLVLPSEGYNNTTTTQTLQVGNTQMVSAKLVNETRFQYIRTRTEQGVVSTAPTVIVEGSLSAGGSPSGALRDSLDRYEFQDYASLDRGKHFVRAGVRYRLARDANDSTANYNGEFIYPDLAAYQANQPTEFFVTRGQTAATVLTGDVGTYAEDEWKARGNLTLNYGLRFESQSAIPDHADWAPRVGFAWSVGQHPNRAAWVVVRGGFGLFYDPFDVANLLTSVRQNGVSQQTLYGANSASALASSPTVYQVSPRLRREYDQIAGLSVEHSFGVKGRISLNYSDVRGDHQYLSRNINAPLPGTVVYGQPSTGVRPLGGNGNLYQFSSDGISKGQIFFVNASARPARRVNLFAVYYFERADGDAAGATSFPSNEYDVSADYGRLDITPVHRLFLNGSVELPGEFQVETLLKANSGLPFNITTGTDLNGDSIYNDRPTFATDLTRASVVRTAYGNFDTLPTPGQKTIPFDYGTAPATMALQLSVSRAIALGPRATVRPAAGAKAVGPAARGDRPFALRLTVEGDNVLNQVNPGVPVGVLSSPLFGRSISLAQGISSNQAANRMVWLRSAFTF